MKRKRIAKDLSDISYKKYRMEHHDFVRVDTPLSRASLSPSLVSYHPKRTNSNLNW